MSEKAAAFLAERERGSTAGKSKMSVRLGADALLIVEKWQAGGQSATQVVAKLLAIADEHLSSLQQNGNEAASGRA